MARRETRRVERPRDEAVLRYARLLLVDARDDRALADQKASLLFAVVGTVATVIVGVAVARSWSPTRLPVPAAVLWWGGNAAAAAGIVLLGAAVYPRLGRGRGDADGTVASFLEAARCRDPQHLRAAMAASVRSERDQITCQLHALSRLTLRKYRCIRAALWCLLAAAVLLLAAGAAGALLAG